MDKIKVLLQSIWYPLSISRYWEIALKKNPKIDLKTCGIYTGSNIPWKGGMNLLEKYSKSPDIVIPFKPGLNIKINYELVKSSLGNWIPDLVLTVDGGMNWKYKPSDGIVATVVTDSHCVDYTHARAISDYFFNMHPEYSKQGDKLLSYAYSPDVHYPMSNIEKDIDAALVGMPYPQRIDWVNRLRERGVSVIFENGPIFDEYRELANRAKIGLNWASLQDTNARVYETCAMKLCLVTNRTPDLAKAGFEEDRHYLGFSSLDEAVEKVMYAKEHPEICDMIANAGYQFVTQNNFTYDALVEKVLKEVGLQ